MTEMKVCECINTKGACTAEFREHMCKVRNINELDDYEPVLPKNNKEDKNG